MRENRTDIPVKTDPSVLQPFLRAIPGRLALCAACLVAGAAWAQDADTQAARTGAPAAAAGPAGAAPADAGVAAKGEPAVQRTVVEDESTRIEELRVRGQTQRVVVQSKLPSVRAYEFVLPVDGRDAGVTGRGAAGQRVWHVLNF